MMSQTSFMLVLLQFCSIILLVYLTNTVTPNPWLFIQLFGIGMALWGIFAMGLHNINTQPEVKSSTLIQRGPYRIIRNPMYLGIILFFLPIVTYENKLTVWLTYLLLISVILYKVRLEEVYLYEKFGEEYLVYKKRTFSFIPYLY